MLLAHIVPGYFAASYSQSHWQPEWTKNQCAFLWLVAVGSTIAPDLDVIYNVLFRGFMNHSVLWTHSLWPYLALGVVWFALWYFDRFRYLQMVFGLAAFGGLSHLVLDMIAHDTPIFYPFSDAMIGIAPAHVREGGLKVYLTDPLFLLEPLLLISMMLHYFGQQKIRRELL